MTEMGSGPNNIEAISLIPTGAEQDQGAITQELEDAFWFNETEVGLMFSNISRRHRCISSHRDTIMLAIKTWYDGYFVGRSAGKYNPRSVTSYFEVLCAEIGHPACQGEQGVAAAIGLAAQNYWVTTGTTRPLEMQFELHRSEVANLVEQLITEHWQHQHPPQRPSQH
ncbi:hypothetical protein GGI20_005182 [Coemansia sp. BCRC 34301]|nr:hypothetical protein GGI20_005182 [Coemansia sp. BCRC 34301]